MAVPTEKWGRYVEITDLAKKLIEDLKNPEMDPGDRRETEGLLDEIREEMLTLDPEMAAEASFQPGRAAMGRANLGMDYGTFKNFDFGDTSMLRDAVNKTSPEAKKKEKPFFRKDNPLHPVLFNAFGQPIAAHLATGGEAGLTRRRMKHMDDYVKMYKMYEDKIGPIRDQRTAKHMANISGIFDRNVQTNWVSNDAVKALKTQELASRAARNANYGVE